MCLLNKIKTKKEAKNQKHSKLRCVENIKLKF